jgi:two-component sensor histidine kinase/AmiR/NasT family two-component response regulator
MVQKRELESYGYQVLHVSSGEKAIEATLNPETAVSLILMDINLGDGIDGTQAAEKILSRMDIPIVFLSSHTEKEIVEKTEKITSYGYVVKQSGIVVLDASIKMAFKLFRSQMAEQEKEESLLKRERLLNLTQKLAKTGGWIQDVKEGSVEWTDELYAIHGFTKESYSSLDEHVRAGIDCFKGSAQDEILKAYSRCVKNGVSYDLVLPFVSASGEAKWIRAATQAEVVNGITETIYGYFMDITEQKKVEEENRLINAMLATEHETSINGILIFDAEGKILLRNRKYNSMFSLKDTANSDMSSHQILDYAAEQVENAEKFKDKVRYFIEHNNLCSREEIHLKNGSVYESYTSPILSADREHLGRMWLYHDITSLKDAEKNALRLVKEKEILLQEVNHRIKNNIASIESMLEMQIVELGETCAAGALQDAAGRMKSMRLIYEKLLASENYQTMSVALYLNELLEAVVGIFSKDKDIVLDVYIDDFQMNIKDLFPLGLILNELVTNSMKYAFKKGQAGSLRISLKQQNGMAEFIVHDSGSGLKAEIIKEQSKSSSGFGILLVTMLAEQLSGTFSQKNAEGLLSRVIFPL